MSSLVLLICVLIGVSQCQKVAWEASDYPNPMREMKQCGRHVGRMSKVCDPNSIISVKEATICHSDSSSKNFTSNMPYIYVITPTKPRLEQKADLTRLSNTLRLVPNLHWIVVEDADDRTLPVENVLANSHLPYTHIVFKTPDAYTAGGRRLVAKGVPQRNAGLGWLRVKHLNNGVVYFADDDNSYDVRVFEEMRYTKKVSVWPVGLITGLRYEAPVITNGKVTGWYTYFKPDRKFCIDMAGFAINLQIILDNSEVWFAMELGLESGFLERLGVEVNDLEPRAENCTKVLVWHTRTQKSSLENEISLLRQFGYKSDRRIEV